MDEADASDRNSEIEWWLRYVLTVTESSTYQAIFNKGVAIGYERARGQARVTQAQRMLILLGENVLGPASVSVRERIEGIDSIDRLERLVENASEVPSWDDLLAAE